MVPQYNKINTSKIDLEKFISVLTQYGL